METYDVAIIGAGVSGASVAERLSRYDLSVALLEAQADVSFGTSKANSGIIHGGFHHSTDHLKARLEVRGAEMYPRLHRELGFPYKQCGILVAAFTPEELTLVGGLYRRGVANGSAGIEVAGAERIRELEPKLSEEVIGGLYAPAGGIIEPYRFVFALVESAQHHGVEVYRNFRVVEAGREGESHVLRSHGGEAVSARYVVNAAGLYADAVSKIFGAEDYSIHPRKGEYHLLDRRTTACPSRVIFPVPTPVSKGMLVIPTVEGTVLIGPTAEEIDDKEDKSTTAGELEEIIHSAKKLVPEVSAADVISSFAGLRPTLPSGDFTIEASSRVPGFIHVAGIQSPGLTAAPAIGEYVKDILLSEGLRLTERPGYRPHAEPARRTRTLSLDELTEEWKKDADAAEIICRCETVSRADIRRAVAAGHTTLDGIKFHSRAGAGRCQGGFCVPRIVAILEEEAGLAAEAVTKRGGESNLVAGRIDGTERPVPRVAPSLHAAGAARPISDEADVLVIGGGAAGMAAASELSARGFSSLIVDREERLGGVLRQCIHNGFGLHELGEELTGPEYAERYEEEVRDSGISVLSSTTVLGLAGNRQEGFFVDTTSAAGGPRRFRGRAVVLAMGSRERNRGSIRTPGSRPAGLFTAGAAQRLVNLEGLIPGKRVVVVGSGDIGLIMARRMRLVGSAVEAVIEIQNIPSGINRNIVQCLDDYAIPLYLGHVVSEIIGRDRVEAVRVCPLESGSPRDDRAFTIPCDTVLFSVGLIPENELSREAGVVLHRQTNGPVVDGARMTSVPGIFAAGNVLHIHDLVDYVAEEARMTGQSVADYLENRPEPARIEVSPGSNVRYVSPGSVPLTQESLIYLRTLVDKTDAVVELRIGGSTVRRIRKPHVQPSEMIRIRLKPDDLAAAATGGDGGARGPGAGTAGRRLEVHIP